MTAEDPAAPVCVDAAPGKLRNGLFLKEVAWYHDRIAFRVFTSRPFRADELATMRLTDDVGTGYEMVPTAQDVIDGHSTIEFTPSVPAGWSWLHLTQPGWGLHILKNGGATPGRGG